MELSPKASAGIIAVVVVILGVVGYMIFRPSEDNMSESERKEVSQKIEQGYKQYHATKGTGTAGGPPSTTTSGGSSNPDAIRQQYMKKYGH